MHILLIAQFHILRLPYPGYQRNKQPKFEHLIDWNDVRFRYRFVISCCCKAVLQKFKLP